jgi:hypothetical protein
VYTVIFLPSPSPGAVLRFLERAHRSPQSINLLLSNPTGSEHWRVLKGENSDSPAWWEKLPEILATAYPLFFIMQVDGDAWTITQWQDGEATPETHSGNGWVNGKWLWMPKSTNAHSLETWAQTHNAPFVALFLRSSSKIIAYETIAVLDQRSLLVETEPLWYRFTLGA